MKHLLLLTALLTAFLFSDRSMGQIPIVSKALPKVTVGVKAGANFQELTGSRWDNVYKAGFTGGAFVGVTKKNFGIQVEGLISTAKFDVVHNIFLPTFNFSVNATNLNVPVLLEYKLIPRLWVQLGPQFSYLQSSKDHGSDEISGNFKRTDFDGVLGLQASLPLHFTASARYILGLSNVDNGFYPNQAWHYRGVQLALGFRIL